MTLLAVALCYSGFTALCLAMEKHQRHVLGRPLGHPTALALRAAGALLLTTSLLVCFTAFTGSLGLVAWTGALTVGGIALVFLLPYAPRTAAIVAGCAPLVVAVALLASS